MNNESITKISSSACETIYRVQLGTIQMNVRAWAIVGGTLALSMEDFFGTKRFNYCAERDSSVDPKWPSWDGVHIEHFTNAADDIYNFVSKVYAQRSIHDDRIKVLGNPRYSRRLYDKANHNYFALEWSPYSTVKTNAYVSPVTGYSAYYWGRIADYPCLQDFIPDRWKEANRIFKEDCKDFQHKRLYEISEEQFQCYAVISLVLEHESKKRIFAYR